MKMNGKLYDTKEIGHVYIYIFKNITQPMKIK